MSRTTIAALKSRIRDLEEEREEAVSWTKHAAGLSDGMSVLRNDLEGRRKTNARLNDENIGLKLRIQDATNALDENRRTIENMEAQISYDRAELERLRNLAAALECDGRRLQKEKIEAMELAKDCAAGAVSFQMEIKKLKSENHCLQGSFDSISFELADLSRRTAGQANEVNRLHDELSRKAPIRSNRPRALRKHTLLRPYGLDGAVNLLCSNMPSDEVPRAFKGWEEGAWEILWEPEAPKAVMRDVAALTPENISSLRMMVSDSRAPGLAEHWNTLTALVHFHELHTVAGENKKEKP